MHEPRTWTAGDPEPPADVTAIRSQLNQVVFTRTASSGCWLATRESGGDGHYYRWYDLAGAGNGDNAAPLTEVQTSSPVHGPSEDGNASERPNAGQETAAEDDPVVLSEHYRILAAELGQAAKAAIARAEAAEADLATERETSAHHMRYAAMREAERDEARAKLAKVHEVVKASAAMNAADALDMLEVIGRIVTLEAGQ